MSTLRARPGACAAAELLAGATGLVHLRPIDLLDLHRNAAKLERPEIFENLLRALLRLQLVEIMLKAAKHFLPREPLDVPGQRELVPEFLFAYLGLALESEREASLGLTPKGLGRKAGFDPVAE